VPVNSQGFVIANNIFGDGYSVDERLNVALADYNLVPPGAHRYGPHDVAADPRFVDAAANRFDVRADSPAVDSGVAGVVASIRGAAYSLPATDLFGGARTALPDRGAYELGGAIGDPAAPVPAPAPDPDPAPDPPAAEPDPAPAPPVTPAPPAVRSPARSGPRPASPVTDSRPAPAVPAPARLIDVTVPRVVSPGSAGRLRAALRACATRRTAASRARCRTAANARLRPAARFSLDRDATVTVAVSTDAAAPRRMSHTTVAARRGPNAVALAARHGLRPGRYRVTLSAVAAGRPAAVAVKRVTVRRG
jgi:hypothetical protein